jgi:hypothetical protein
MKRLSETAHTAARSFPNNWELQAVSSLIGFQLRQNAVHSLGCGFGYYGRQIQ